MFASKLPNISLTIMLLKPMDIFARNYKSGNLQTGSLKWNQVVFLFDQTAIPRGKKSPKIASCSCHFWTLRLKNPLA